MSTEPHIHDRVAIRSTDGFNGKQGVLVGLRWYGRRIVPFQRQEVQKVSKQ